jgi:hypothetical protein
MAQSVTRRAALKKIGVGLVGMALACFGLANRAEAGKACVENADCPTGNFCCNGVCKQTIPDWCDQTNNACCCHCVGKGHNAHMDTAFPVCSPAYNNCVSICAYAGFINPRICG